MKTLQELALDAGLLQCRDPFWSASTNELSRFRDLVLEEAASVCDANTRRHADLADKADEETDYEEKPYYQGASIGSNDCAHAIRAMKGQK
jgi:hypothetical protein